jgi:hypothetical protein
MADWVGFGSLFTWNTLELRFATAAYNDTRCVFYSVSDVNVVALLVGAHVDRNH